VNRLGACGLVLATAVALTGCGSDAKPEAEPKPSASPTAPPGLVAPKPEKPKAADTGSSAVDYGYYFVRLVEYALRTRSARPVQAEAFDLARCSVCRKLDTAVQEMRKKGIYQITPDLRVGRFSAVSTSDGYTVAGRFVFPSGRFVKLDGSKVDEATGGPYRFDADLRWDATRSRWRVVDYTFLPTGTSG
jgi:hypothetical protein